jgi:D-alanine-D-alanine ligase
MVLIGGDSAEREVSLDTGREVAIALQKTGHEITLVDSGGSRQGLDLFVEGHIVDYLLEPEKILPADRVEPRALEGKAPAGMSDFDCVFIALHGGSGENGTLQALLDLAGVRYTGSDLSASALAMDKYRSKLLFQALGIPVPRLLFFGSSHDTLALVESEDSLGLTYPLVVKPNQQGSTIGLTIVHEPEALTAAVKLAAEYDDYILIEEYIPGREITAAVLGDEALPLVEILPKSGFYDYKAKYASGESQYVCPAEVPELVEADAKRFALQAYHGIGCCGYARVDFRLSPDDKLYCLELNTLPGMTATSLVPKAAKAAGMSFEQLLQKIVDLAVSDNELT